jgi:serine/threonine-protein kinase
MESERQILNGRYQLLSRSGAGGMATVYKAQDLLLGRLVAIKMLHENLTSDEEFLHRFHQEARAAAKLSHPNIVTVHDIGQDEGREYIVMEYVEGRTLKQAIRDYEARDVLMPINRAVDLAIQICAGIGYAHRAGLVHCDVKPQNMLVTRDERVKVADFGIARAMNQISLHDPDLIWGTPQYFSPEQAAGEPATPASDVYAIGIILYEMLTGRLPFEAESHTAVALKHIQETPPLISRLNPAVPPQLEQIVQKVLSKEPSGRYRTGDQLGRILTSYRQSSMEDTGPQRPLRVAPAVAPTPPLSLADEITPPQPMSPPPEYSRSYRRRRPTYEPGGSAYEQSGSAYEPPVAHVPVPEPEGTDWLAVSLGLLATLSLLGLVPLWYAVYLAWSIW